MLQKSSRFVRPVCSATMPKTKASRLRAAEFRDIFKTDGPVLFCLACEKTISANRRFLVQQHLKTATPRGQSTKVKFSTATCELECTFHVQMFWFCDGPLYGILCCKRPFLEAGGCWTVDISWEVHRPAHTARIDNTKRLPGPLLSGYPTDDLHQLEVTESVDFNRRNDRHFRTLRSLCCRRATWTRDMWKELLIDSRASKGQSFNSGTAVRRLRSNAQRACGCKWRAAFHYGCGSLHGEGGFCSWCHIPEDHSRRLCSSCAIHSSRGS